MPYLKISLGIFFVLAASRFVPHPPNFTSLIALSFYVPIFFGIKFIPIVLLSFFITDFFIGFHNITFFTWGSVLVIGMLSKFFYKTLILRISGACTGTLIFFIITNFGVWTFGSYGYNIEGLTACYVAAIPFFGNTVISTMLFSLIFETIRGFLSSKRFIKIY
jgi:hypothetical protein